LFRGMRVLFLRSGSDRAVPGSAPDVAPIDYRGRVHRSCVATLGVPKAA
jgi:hypothetical protein